MNIKGRLAIAKGKAVGIHLLYPEVYRFPVHPSVAARKLGIHVFCEDTRLYEYFDYDLEAKRIYINSNLSRRKLRYSIALIFASICLFLEKYSVDLMNLSCFLRACSSVVANVTTEEEDKSLSSS